MTRTPQPPLHVLPRPGLLQQPTVERKRAVHRPFPPTRKWNRPRARSSELRAVTIRAQDNQLDPLHHLLG